MPARLKAFLGFPSLLAPLCFAVNAATAQAQLPVSVHPSFFQASSGVAVTNWLTWGYNWYVQRWPWAKVGVHTWARNFREGFAWDDDCFLDNQLAHAYHGSFYLSSARASGYGFWSSLPFVAFGSASWELLGENIRPSLNDFINTTLGGSAIGEVTYRLGSLVRSRRSGDRAGLDRQLASFAISPLGRIQALMYPMGDPSLYSGSELGDPVGIAAGREKGRTFLELTIRYRDPFAAEIQHPYDAFEFNLELRPEGSIAVSSVMISGLLARRILHTSDNGRLVLGLFQHYDYQDRSGLEFGDQSFSGGIWYRRMMGSRNHVDLGLHAEGVVLGAISSEQGHYWRRDYDLGPGAGGRFRAAFARDGREWLRFDSRLIWLHSLHGSGGDHQATFLRLAGAVPVRGPLRVGGDFAIVSRHSRYPNLVRHEQTGSQLRAYLAWIPS